MLKIHMLYNLLQLNSSIENNLFIYFKVNAIYLNELMKKSTKLLHIYSMCADIISNLLISIKLHLAASLQTSKYNNRTKTNFTN